MQKLDVDEDRQPQKPSLEDNIGGGGTNISTSRYNHIDLKYLAQERVLKAIERLKKCKGKSNQNRMEDFFGKVRRIYR